VILAHRAVGITILALTIARIGRRLTRRPPPLPPGIAGSTRGAAKAAHAAFHVQLVALPFSGWILSSNPEHARPMT
jgi:cytochrome b561